MVDVVLVLLIELGGEEEFLENLFLEELFLGDRGGGDLGERSGDNVCFFLAFFFPFGESGGEGVNCDDVELVTSVLDVLFNFFC